MTGENKVEGLSPNDNPVLASITGFSGLMYQGVDFRSSDQTLVVKRAGYS